MPKNLNRRMSPAQFQACIPLVRQLAKDRVAAARAVLVDGEKPVEVAKRYDWSRQAVGICVNRLCEALESYQAAKRFEAEMIEADLPPGWRVETVAAPDYVLAKLRTEIETAASAAGIPITALSIE